MLKMVFTVIQVILALFLVVVVLLQESKTSGINGAVSGGADTFLSKNKAKSWDARLARYTKWVAIAFLVLTLVIALL